MEKINNEIYGVSFEYGMPVYAKRFNNTEEAKKWSFQEEKFRYKEFLTKDEVLEVFEIKECDLNDIITYYKWKR